MKIGLYFGSFNPVHLGHLVLAQSAINEVHLDQVWFMVTPHNPMKKKTGLLDGHHRINMVRDAIEGHIQLRASDLEFSLPQPNYTAVTLTHLKEKYPQDDFSLILGEDNLKHLPQWFNSNYIFKNFPLLVYPRSLEKEPNSYPIPDFAQIQWINSPIINISSSQIRALVKSKKSIKYLVPESVERAIMEMRFYQ